MKHRLSTTHCFLAFAAVAFAAQAQTRAGIQSGLSMISPYPADGLFRAEIQDQYVFLKPPDKYVVSYSGSLDPTARPGPNERIEFPITFPSQVSPAVDVRVEALSNGEYLYSYTIFNRGDAKTAIASVRLRTRSIEAVEDLASPVNSPGWKLARLRNPEDHLGPAWDATSPLNSGGGPVQFSVRSTAKPGLAEMTFLGSPIADSSIDRLPESVKAHIGKLQRGVLRSVTLFTVGPIYAPDVNPFAVAQDTLGQIEMLRDDRKNTAYLTELRSKLKQYVDNTGSAVQMLEDIRVKPDFRVVARPVSYEDGIFQKALVGTLGIK